MNFEAFILGCGGMMPLPYRHLTSVLLRREGDIFLFDCGEGTQVSLRRLNLRWKKINAIFISHTHADHVTGLPGLLMLSSQVDREEPLYIFGPPKTAEYVNANRKILDMYINYDIIVEEINPSVSGCVFSGQDFDVFSFPLKHTKVCVGYSFVEHPRPGAFNPDKALEMGVPCGPLWSKLQKGESVTALDGSIVKPEQVMGAPRHGRKFSYVTDSVAIPSIAGEVKDSDLFICEGMFDQELSETASEKKHMTASQAAGLAKAAGVKKLGLIHYSPRYTDSDLKKLLEEARAVFPESVLTKDRMVFPIEYED